MLFLVYIFVLRIYLNSHSSSLLNNSTARVDNWKLNQFTFMLITLRKLKKKLDDSLFLLGSMTFNEIFTSQTNFLLDVISAI